MFCNMSVSLCTIVEVVKAQSLSSIDRLDIDAVISAGGDGTFLEAASLINFTPLQCFCSSTDVSCSKCVIEENSFNFREVGSTQVANDDIENRTKIRKRPLWVFGLNTNPARSEGQLLLKSSTLKKNYSNSSESNNMNQDNCNKSSFLEQKSHETFLASSEINDIQKNKKINDHHNCLTKAIQRLVDRDYVPIQRRRLRVSIMERFPLSSQQGSSSIPFTRLCCSNYSNRFSWMDTLSSKNSQFENNNVIIFVS
jgi:hypothetical protein